jgi:hypothetical protein
LLATVNANSATKYSCSDTANCTSIELATLQWGSAFVTLNPFVSNTNYTPVSATMSDWGAYKVPGMQKAPEFSFYTSSDYANLAEPFATDLKLNKT